jgi:hypothetical protein
MGKRGRCNPNSLQKATKTDPRKAATIAKHTTDAYKKFDKKQRKLSCLSINKPYSSLFLCLYSLLKETSMDTTLVFFIFYQFLLEWLK